MGKLFERGFILWSWEFCRIALHTSESYAIVENPLSHGDHINT